METTPPQLHTPVLETPRLILRPARMSDAPALQRIFPQWEVVRYLSVGVPWPYPDDGAETHLRQSTARVEAGQTCGWVLCLKSGADDPIGRIDFHPFQDDGEMRGFWLDPAHWGKGLMSEAADRVTDFVFRDLGWPHIVVSNAVANVASGRVKERQGATLIEVTTGKFLAGDLPKQVWRIDAADWLARHPAPPV